MEATEQSDIGRLIDQQKDTAVNRLLAGVAILGVPRCSPFLQPCTPYGLEPAHLLHLLALLTVICLYLLRHRMGAQKKARILLLVPMTIAVVGLMTYGFVGNGLMWSMFSLFLAMAFINLRTSYWVGGIIMTAIALSSYQFVVNQRVFPGDADRYLGSWPGWTVAVFGGAAFSVLIVSIVSMQRDQTEKFLVMLERKNKAILYMADHDDLTGLVVYRIFVQAVEHSLEQARREKRHIAVCFIDLDDFKQVNDQFGHDAGDFVLRAIAEGIQGLIRASDVVSRMGGDEYVVLINSAEPLKLDEFCRRLLGIISKKRDYDGKSIAITASIGVAQRSNDEETAEHLIKRADRFMYLAKLEEKNGFRIS